MPTSWDGKEERRRFQIPNTPGNYPENLLIYLRKIISNLTLLNSLYTPKRKHGIILASDIRNFTKTVSSTDPSIIQSFLTYFFTDAVETIHNHGGYVNKFLGDGLLAHFTDDKEYEALDVSEEMIRKFTSLRKQYHLDYCNLSVAISKAEYVETTIGKSKYVDFTLIGPEVNSLFRLLSSTEGGLIYVNKEYINSLNETHHYVFVGTKEFKGIVAPMECYSIIRSKTEEEKKNIKPQVCTKDLCPKYFLICHNAWKFGKDMRDVNTQKEYIFRLDCNVCGEQNNRCWNWDNCIPKFDKASKGKSSECCHICSNFRNCFHSYQLGRQGLDMITCNKTLLEIF